LNSLHRTNSNLFQRLMVEGTSVASLHASHYTLCLLTYEYINSSCGRRAKVPIHGTFVVMTWAAGSLGKALATGESGNLQLVAREKRAT
jgi:hypothetical protein